MVEDLTGNIRRICDGLAREIAKRVDGENREIVERHASEVLRDWFLGDFIPNDNGG